MAFASKQLLHDRLNARHARLSTNQHDFINLAGVNAGIFHALLRRSNRALKNVFDHRLELRPRQFLHQMLRSAGISSDERQVDLVLHGGRELDLGPFRRITQTLQCHLVALTAQVEAFIFLKFVDQPVHQALVNIVAAKVSVAVGSFDFDHAFADFEHRDIKCTAAEVVHGDGLVLTLIEAVSQRRRRRLIDDSLHLEPGNLPGIFGRLALRIIEVRRHSDNRLSNFLAEIIFRSLLQLLQNQRGDLRRSLLLALCNHRYVVAFALHFIWDHLHLFVHFVVAPPHKTLDRINRVLGIGDGLPLSHLPDQPLPSLGESDDRRGSAASFFISDDLGLATLHNSHAGVGGAEVNSDNLGHIAPPKLISALQSV